MKVTGSLSKKELLREVAALRQRVAELENDMADCRAVEEALKESEERFSAIINNLSDGLLVADKETKKFLMGNPAIHDMLGCSAEELHHLGVKDIHPEQDLPWATDRFEELVRKEIKIARDVPVRRKDGRVFYADINCSFPIVLNGRECLMGAFRDSTDRRMTEEALRESETKYRSIFENAMEGIFQSTPEGRYLSVNPAFVRMFGYASQEEMLKGITDMGRQIYVHPEDRERLKNLLAERGRVEAFETQVYRGDGRIIWISINARVVRDATGAILYYEGTNLDITERKQTEKALALANSYNRSLIEASPDTFFIIDFAGTITDVNSRAEAVTGYSRGDLIGTDFSDYFTDREKATAGYQQVLQDGSVRDYELELRHSDGKTTPVLFNASVYQDDVGTAVGVFAVPRDISVRKRVEAELRKANDELEQRIEERTLELSAKTRRLEELNTALKVLLEQRDEDREGLEQAIMGNVKKLLLPFLEKLKMSGLTSEQKTYLDILDLHLKDITSQFTRKLTAQMLGLTTTEIQIANLIREGRATKEIARILRCSRYTVMFHRSNLRRKLQVKRKKVNLKSYLQEILK